MAFSLLILNVIFFRNHVSGVPKKKFQCPIKMPKKVVCLVVLYPNVRFFIWSSGTFLWDGRTFFWDTRYSFYLILIRRLIICRILTIVSTPKKLYQDTCEDAPFLSIRESSPLKCNGFEQLS